MPRGVNIEDLPGSVRDKLIVSGAVIVEPRLLLVAHVLLTLEGQTTGTALAVLEQCGNLIRNERDNHGKRVSGYNKEQWRLKKERITLNNPEGKVRA